MKNRLIGLINKLFRKFGWRALRLIQFGGHIYEVTKIVRMIERRMNKNGFFIFSENRPQKKPLPWSSFLIRVEPEGLRNYFHVIEKQLFTIELDIMLKQYKSIIQIPKFANIWF